MHVGVPGGGQRNAQPPGEVRGEHAKFRRSGEMQYIGPKGVQGVGNLVMPTPEKGIKGKIFFKADRGAGARQLEYRDGALPVHEGRPFRAWETGSDAQHGQSAALCVGDKLAAGVRNAVHLMKGVREVGDAERHHGLSLVDGRQRQWIGDVVSHPVLTHAPLQVRLPGDPGGGSVSVTRQQRQSD